MIHFPLWYWEGYFYSYYLENYNKCLAKKNSSKCKWCTTHNWALDYYLSGGTCGLHTKKVLLHPTYNGGWKVLRCYRPDGRADLVIWLIPSIVFFMILLSSILYKWNIFMFWYLFDVLCHLSLPTSLQNKWFISKCLKMEYGVTIICFRIYGIILWTLI